jgi:hypothetical protein
LAREGIDCAVRVGSLVDPGLVADELGFLPQEVPLYGVRRYLDSGELISVLDDCPP